MTRCLVSSREQEDAMTTLSLTPRPLRRLGIIMEPNPTDPREVEGVLNPAVTRGPDGALYLLPRLVGAAAGSGSWRRQRAYAHDSPSGVYLGQHERDRQGLDLYRRPQGGSPTIVARRRSAGPD